MSPTSKPKTRILFVCSGNTCRSVMAEYMARARFSDKLEVASAGFSPQSASDAENAIFTLSNYLGIDASAHQPRDVRTVDPSAFDLVVAMAAEHATSFRALFPQFQKERLIKWSISDPFGDDLAEYRACAERIFKSIKSLPPLRPTPGPSR